MGKCTEWPYRNSICTTKEIQVAMSNCHSPLSHSIVTTKEIQVAMSKCHSPLPLDACVNDVKGFSLLAGSGGILWYGQMGLERIAKGLEVLKASDHMAKFNALRICSELSA